ncbi:MAG: PLP-dependent aminotransferase family protein, partial [Gemmobacter sp.]
EGRSEEAFVAEARNLGVAVAAGSAFRATEKGRHDSVRVSLGSTHAGELRHGLSILSALLTEASEPPLPAI